MLQLLQLLHNLKAKIFFSQFSNSIFMVKKLHHLSCFWCENHFFTSTRLLYTQVNISTQKQILSKLQPHEPP